MSKNPIYIGSQKASTKEGEVKGELTFFKNENYYKISNHDAMRPFFMSIVSDSNHWMFLSSNGGLSSGRKNASSPLFPYYTDDKITESADITGSKTIIQIHEEDRTLLWEPFSDRHLGSYKITRNLYKNSLGNKVLFEEINTDLGLTFRYHWNSSDQFGFIKKSTLINNTNKEIEVSLLDGIQNIMPYGVDTSLQNESSNLVDAYKRNELDAEIGLGIFALSAIIVDKAEPSEALKATTVWSTGIKNAKYLVSSTQLNAFRRGKKITQEIDVKAKKGAYFIHVNTTIQSNSERKWMTVAEVNQTRADISKISHIIKTKKDIFSIIDQDIELGSKNLLKLNGASDGIQLTADSLNNTRHFSNTLFNIMRGGIFDNNYKIEKSDFSIYIQNANSEVYLAKKNLLEKLPEEFELSFLKELAEGNEDSNFKRLAFEYMPLKFSRRHGDPSRPWNKFSINTTAEDGSKILDYEGNWRDIFQNWEALAHSYPAFIESMIHKFLNATTFDGYNPYRVTKDGFDWETIEPDDPWSYIGYWGDHQIIYLLKFLEFIEKHYPNKLGAYFTQNIFVYANVPYKIKSYEDILKNPKDTILFDEELDAKINQERKKIGADGALLKDADTSICKVNLLEKLLATVLAKVSNFIPEGGIWMNTQRPEWNDANNALVGNGVSMVTLYYLRRFLNFFDKLVSKIPEENLEISNELKVFFDSITETFNANLSILSGKITDSDRKTVMDGLGNAGSSYRNNIYVNGFASTKENITKSELSHFVTVVLKYLDHSINANKRADKLYHSYNLMTLKNTNEVSISYLSEMLEGQVAVLSSGYISGTSALELLDALKNSALFRADQYSYILYPNKELSRFQDKNNIPEARVKQSALIQQLTADGNSQIVEKDLEGHFHFNGSFNNANSLKDALGQLSQEQYGKLITKETNLLLEVFEEIFDHKSFTGRSGTFFGYEGLGSIYWHMVSKLLLSAQETCLAAIATKESAVTIGKLLDHYYEIQAGIGVHKSPELYGAFPTDPYSHTPGGKGAQQPGMTGQVKEDILSRFGELGVFVNDGILSFNPCLLREEEFLNIPATFTYNTINNEVKEIPLQENELCFTYCQTPIIYRRTDKEGVAVVFNNESILEFTSLHLGLETSNKIFERTGEINYIIVSLKNK